MIYALFYFKPIYYFANESRNVVDSVTVNKEASNILDYWTFKNKNHGTQEKPGSRCLQIEKCFF